jgi:hypothetical protein
MGRYIAIVDRAHPRVAGFIKHLRSKGVTERGISNILSFAANKRVNKYLVEEAPTLQNIYDTDDVSLLTYVYQMVKDDEDNIRLHRIYSGAVNRYIEYLSGNRIGSKAEKGNRNNKKNKRKKENK